MSLLGISHFTVTSALGRGRAAHVQALSRGASGLKKAAFDACTLDCWLGEVEGLSAALPPALAIWECRNNRLAWLALQADDFLNAAVALRSRYGETRVGVFVGTSTAGIHSAELAYREMSTGYEAWGVGQRPDSGHGSTSLHPTHGPGPIAHYPSSLPDWFDYRHTQNIFSTADFVAQALQLKGHVMAISTACSSSAKVFAAAYRATQIGLCDAAIVGGVDSLCLTTLYGFNSLQLLSNDVCRPADVARRGISIGEAAGFAILERPAAATHDYALLGYGESSDAHHMSSPDPDGRGAAAAMRAALERAALPPEKIDYINLHGTGTQANDAAEDRGVVSVFSTATPCSSTKGWTGHTLGAAGMVEAALSLLCVETGLLPRSLQTQTPDPALTAAVLMATRRAVVNLVMSNSFGFGGSNCSLILGRSQ